MTAKPVAGAWTVGENPRLLFFPHIKPSAHTWCACCRPAGRSGARLAGEEQRFSSDSRVALAFYFASKGMVLPAAQNGGLPVSTVNVPESRCAVPQGQKTDQLPKFLEMVIAGPTKQVNARGEDEEDGLLLLRPGHPPAGRSMAGRLRFDQQDDHQRLLSARFVTEQKPNRRSVTFLPVENIPALKGARHLCCGDVAAQPLPPRIPDHLYYVSDFGLHVRQYAGRGADAFVSSLTTGRAAGVEIVVGPTARSRPRRNRRRRPRKFRRTAEGRAKVVVAKKGEQLSLIALMNRRSTSPSSTSAAATSAPVRLFASQRPQPLPPRREVRRFR